MRTIDSYLGKGMSLALAGHVNPDGDCVGSCLGLYNYLKKNRPDINVDVYLETIRPVFNYLQGIDQIHGSLADNKRYDLLILLDVSSQDRIGVADELFKKVEKVLCIDHHVTNPGLGHENVILPNASSTCEVLFGLMEPEKIDRNTAEALYTGLIHDSGVFQYSNTAPRTMEIGAFLMGKGIEHTRIIEDSFYKKSYGASRMMGKVLMDSLLFEEGKVIGGFAYLKDMAAMGVGPADLEGIVSQLRLTENVECAVFVYERAPGIFKVSMRSNGVVDVAKIAMKHGGGGHSMASGCESRLDPLETIRIIAKEAGRQLEQAGE